MDIIQKQARSVVDTKAVSYKGMSGPMAIIRKKVRAYGYHIVAGKGL